MTRSASVRKTAPRSHTKTQAKESSVWIHISPVLLAVLAVFFAICVIVGEGAVGRAVRNVLTGLFGGAAYVLPVVFLCRAIFWNRDVSEDRNTSRTICTVGVLVLITMLLHILGGGADTWSVREHYEAGMQLVGGGVVGGVLGKLILLCVGRVCSLIMLFAGILVLALYACGITLRGAAIWIAYRIRYAGERQEEKRAEKEEKRRMAGPSKREVREEEYLAYLRDKMQKKRDERSEKTDEPKKNVLQPASAAKPSVYRVKRRRTKLMIDGETADGAQEDGKIDFSAAEEMREEISAGTEQTPVQIPIPPEGTDLDDQIYNEVMRRTRERIEKNRQTENIQDGTGAAGEISGQVPETVSDGTQTAGENTEEGKFDVSGIFVNPESAELLDKLSEAYRNPADPKRDSASSDLPMTEVQQKPPVKAKPAVYSYPPIDLLTAGEPHTDDNIREELEENAVKLVDTLRSFKVITKIENISRGPTITRYELKPEPGTKVRSITNLVDDIALNLATTGVRIEAPIPGKSAVGIEVPNKTRNTVHLRSLIETDGFVRAKSKLTVCLGEDVAGDAVYFDIAKMPHLLIAGATGAGKSVCINSVITSLLYKASPEEVKLILIDPKKVELSIYNGIPHLLVPVVSEPKKAAGSLSWAVGEMERRYELLENVGVRDIRAFNEITKDDPDYEYMPRIVIVIDELADLMMTAPDDVEDSICRIAQKARAAGMHLVIGTQRPSVDVITGLIKANIPSRIAFRTSSQIDSRTIIDIGSASNLIGMGDMLFAPVGALKPVRVQGAFVSESDVEEVVNYIRNMNSGYENAEQTEKITNEIEREAQRCGSLSGKHGSSDESDDDEGGNEDPMLKQAIELAIDSGKISTSLIQRRLSLGYGRAAKLIDRMEQLGYVSAPEGSKPREVLISKQDYMEMRLKDETPF